MTLLTRDCDHTVRAEWREGGCTVTVEAWEAARAYDRASRMLGVAWGPCLPTERGSWKMAGVAQNPR